VFENRVLRRIFGPRRNELKREWRKLHNDELHNVYSSSSVMRMVKSRRMGWEGHIARKERKLVHVGYLWESQKGRDY
jgi:hypothetical protein